MNLRRGCCGSGLCSLVVLDCRRRRVCLGVRTVVGGAVWRGEAWVSTSPPVPSSSGRMSRHPAAGCPAASTVGEFELRWRDMLIDLYTPYWTDKTPIEQWRINGPQ